MDHPAGQLTPPAPQHGQGVPVRHAEVQHQGQSQPPGQAQLIPEPQQLGQPVLPGQVIVQPGLADGRHAGLPGPGLQLPALPPGGLMGPGGVHAHRQADEVRMLPVQGSGPAVGLKVDAGLDGKDNAALPQTVQQVLSLSFLGLQITCKIAEYAVVALMAVVSVAFDDHARVLLSGVTLLPTPPAARGPPRGPWRPRSG